MSNIADPRTDVRRVEAVRALVGVNCQLQASLYQHNDYVAQQRIEQLSKENFFLLKSVEISKSCEMSMFSDSSPPLKE
jgi:hypothetical protein